MSRTTPVCQHASTGGERSMQAHSTPPPFQEMVRSGGPTQSAVSRGNGSTCAQSQVGGAYGCLPALSASKEGVQVQPKG